MRVFLKKYGVLPSQVVLMHINQTSVATVDASNRFVVSKLGNDIHSVVVTYGYMEQPNVRGVLKTLKQQKLLPVAAERWIIEVGEEDLIVDPSVGPIKRTAIIMFGWILRLSTPAHKYLGLVYDAAVSKEVVPIVFSKRGTRVALPELELTTSTKG